MKEEQESRGLRDRGDKPEEWCGQNHWRSECQVEGFREAPSPFAKPTFASKQTDGFAQSSSVLYTTFYRRLALTLSWNKNKVPWRMTSSWMCRLVAIERTTFRRKVSPSSSGWTELTSFCYRSYLDDSFTLIFETKRSPETSVLTRATRCHIPEDDYSSWSPPWKPQILHSINWLDIVAET
jgi:hypothetical protein